MNERRGALLIISRIAIKHFRCLRDVDLKLESYSPLVGANGAGKSTVLEAVRFVFDRRFQTGENHVNPECVSEPLSVTVTLDKLSSAEQARLRALLRPDGTIVLSRRIHFSQDGPDDSYSVCVSTHQPFQGIRDLLASAENTLAKTTYNEFVGKNPNYGLKAVTKFADVEECLRCWEMENETECIDAEQLRSIKGLQVLGWPFVDIVYVPAVKDASDDLDGRSPLQALLNVLVSTPAESTPAMDKLRAHVKNTYAALFPNPAQNLVDVATTISSELSEFAPGSSVELTWDQDYEPELGSPPIAIEVVEDAHSSDISEKGNGVQRAVIMALITSMDKLQALATPDDSTIEQPSERRDLILLIEEPELYQHPIRARHFAEALRQRTRSAVGPKTQVIFSTHSPNFISLSDFAGLRLVRRLPKEANHIPARVIGSTDFDSVASELARAQDAGSALFSGHDLQTRLHGVVDTSLREGFFADSIVLVEGENDVAPIIGGLRARRIDYEALGLAILPVTGKSNIDKPLVIFRQLGIPIYTVFDGDSNCKVEARDSSARTNRSLARLLGFAPDDFPPTHIGEIFAVFHENMDSTIRGEMGAPFDEELKNVANAFGYEGISKAKKVPVVFATVIENLAGKGYVSATLNALIDRIHSFALGAQKKSS